MAQPQMMQIKLSRFDAQPWGFRLQGGTDFAQPLLVQKVNGGSLAEKAGLMPGDAVIKINDVDVFNLRHKDAQDIVVRSGNNFVMTVQRGGSTWRPHVQLTGNVPHPNAGNLHTVTKTSLAHKQQEVQHIGSGYNNSARPFGGSAVDGNVKSIVNKQYNTPVGIYSDESIAETLSAQAEVLAGGVLGVNFKKNEKEYQADKSEVLKFLREEESGTSTPEPPSATSYYATKSHAIGGNELRSPQTEERITAKFQKPTTTQAPPPSAPAPSKVEIPVPTEPEQPDPRLIVMPVCPALQTPEYKEEMEKAAAAAADGDQPKPYTASGHPACSMCGVGIVGVFVRIKDKNLHVECFKCATCGTNLKNQGYYNFNNKLYCDIHAKLAALQNPPPGTEGYVPVPIKPNTKLSASTISSALNTHGYNNGVSNGSSTPTPAPAADMNLNDLPLPPPPSPTQLQQYEQDQGNVTNISNIPPPPPHTRTLSSLSSMSSGSNTTHSSTHSLSPTPYQYQHQGQGPCNNVIMQTHNITMDPYASTSPMHSRQTSSSSSSLNYASDNNYMTSPPPPPPPPLPLPSMLPPAAEDNRNGDLYIDTMKQQQNAIGSNNSSKLLTNRNNENDKNSYNKSGNGNGIGVGNGTTFQPNTHKVAPTAVTGPTSTITTTKSPSSSNIPIVDKSLINSNNTYNPESNTTTTTTTFNTGTNDMSSTMASSGPSVQPTSETSSNGVGGDKPFEYVTLTGNVIRSVVPPGKGTNVNYKVNNQGYARPYGAPPAAAPKSPVTFPPQTQQWNAPPPTQPKPSAPAGNPYATLPRSNVGQGQVQQQQEQQYQKQQQTSSYASNLTQASTKSSSASYTTMAYDKVATSLSKHEAHEVIEETAQDLEHSEVIFPPPSPLSHLHTKTSTGLHRPENIPKYQRNWTVLPSQSPVRTPEPHELRENVPLAFVDTPKTPGHSMGSYENTVHKPVAQMSTRTSSATNNNTTSSSTTNNNSNLTAHQQHTSASAYGSTSVMSSQADQRHQQSVASASSHSSHSMARPQATKPTTVPIIIEDRAGPVTMAFQPLDEHMVRDHSQTPSRPYTPSRPAPIVPRYQTPEKLCFDECPAAHARDYDFRSASPFPDRARSPACGPPPNPLAAIRAPRIKDPDVSSMSPRVLQAGSITTGQSYLGAQQAQKQEQILAHTESSSHSGMQSFSQQPEKKEEYQIGNMSVQKREQSSRMAEQQQRQMQSQTTTQVGNTQIERRRKVTEEYEHTSSAKTVEIRTGSQSSSTDRRQSTASYGKGYVANQARRLSGLEQEITNLTPQSQAISARAAHLTENKFPEFHSPEPLEKFPTKPLLPSYDEPKPPSYIVSGASTKSVANTSSSCYQQKQEQKQLSTAYGSSVFSSQQQQQQQQKSLTTYSSVSSSQQQQQQQVNTVSSSVTKASAATNNQAYKSITAGTNNQTATSSSSASTGICPVTGTFCRPGHTCCKQQSMHSNNNTNNNNNNNNVSNGAAYRPNASLGSASNASNFAANSQPPRQQQQQQSQATAPATKAPAASSASAPTTMSNQNNNGGSAGSTGSAGGMAPKGGSYGATSAPKRGRGVMNKPAGPGVRIPLCNSCGTQVRGPFITALGKIWCPEHFHCTNGNCRRPLQDIGFVEEKGDLYCEYCFEKYLAPGCSKCGGKIKGDCLNAIGKHFHPECFSCGHCGKLFGNTPFFLEDGMPYCEADWNELFTTKCFACGFPVEAGDRWVEALNHNYHSQCFNCTYCKQNLEGQSFYNKGGRPFCKNHAR
ncbi:Z band alternatively spliced PDZ-motif protein 52 isoform X8 [Haematobia irritans]|uniref:Z band alternatively spliced PDZ-motif protein 52 isoform X8 n=1 Tax=Haematobia irritans TaxID=7368 RepID=UPI003F4F6032